MLITSAAGTAAAAGKRMHAHTVTCPGSYGSIKTLTVALVNRQNTSRGKVGKSSQQIFYSAVKREETREAKGNNTLSE